MDLLLAFFNPSVHAVIFDDKRQEKGVFVVIFLLKTLQIVVGKLLAKGSLKIIFLIKLNFASPYSCPNGGTVAKGFADC